MGFFDKMAIRKYGKIADKVLWRLTPQCRTSLERQEYHQEHQR